MANDLFDLFKDKLKIEGGLVASDPQNLENISEIEEEQEMVLEKIAALEEVQVKVDYSDFSNFVFFNSALDYFNITGEKILNEYPFDGTLDEIEKFKKNLDGYQKHVLVNWPKYAGHLRFNTSVSSSYVKIEDIGRESGTSVGGLLSPNTGSLTIEAWVEPAALLTGADDVIVLVEKESSENGYGLYLTGSNIVFAVKSGSTIDSVSTPFEAGKVTFVSAVMDRSLYTGSLSLITGSQTEFPVLAATSSMNFYGRLDIASTSPLTIASGSATTLKDSANADIVYFTGSLDEVKVWKKVRSVNELSSSFNVKQYAQKNLIGLWRFNSAGDSLEEEHNRIAIDYSGKKLNGRIQNYYSDLRGSGSLLIQEYPDYTLNIRSSEVISLITEQQISGSEYDRQNENRITNHFPEKFFILEDQYSDEEITKNFLYVMARHYDRIKLHIDQFLYILKVNYGDFNQTPDALLDVVAKFFGWEFTGNFLNADAFQYILGRNILSNVDGNKNLDKELFEIKNSFWKRTLLNLNHIYKTKGTRESIKALLRCYGVNENFVRIKEFGSIPSVGIQTNRIKAEKSVYALGFASGSNFFSSVSGTLSSPISSSWSIEGHFKFPLTSSAQIPATSLTGTLWSLVDSGGDYVTLSYAKDSVGSHTGTLILSASDGSSVVMLEDAGIFNNEWHSISVTMDHISSSLAVNAKRLNEDEIEAEFSAVSSSISNEIYTLGSFNSLTLGAKPTDALYSGEFWSHELRAWNKRLSDEELKDHTLNFQSFGVGNVEEQETDIKLHWKLAEGENANASGELTLFYTPLPGGLTPYGTGFAASENPYDKFLVDYNYIASMDFGWSEDKIRIFDDSIVPVDRTIDDEKIVSVEFNMVDALNEDIVQTMSSLEELNERIGSPVNKHRVNYDELEIMRNIYFSRLQGKLNFTVFADMLDFFDRSFIDMVRKLVPARANFIGDEFVIESHMFERPKVIYERRKNQEIEFAPIGTIEMWSRNFVSPLFLPGPGSYDLHIASEFVLTGTLDSAAAGSFDSSGLLYDEVLPVTGSLTATGEGYTEPSLLADFNFTEPNALNLSAMFANADSWWDMQETSGTTLSDQAGSNDLSAAASVLVGQVASDVYLGGGFGNKRAIETTNTSGGASAGTSSFADAPVSSSLAVCVVFRVPNVAAGQTIAGKGDATDGYQLNFVNSLGYVGGFLEVGSVSVSVGQIAQNHADGATHYAMLVIDRTANTVRAYSDLGDSTIAGDISSLGSMVHANAFKLGYIGAGLASTPSGMQSLGAAVWTGAAAESAASDVAAAWTHATDPTGLLTTATRSDLISVPTSVSTVGHFGTNQLPIGYSSLLSGTGLGLYCNSVLTNMLSYSEAWNGNWTVSGATTDGVGGDAPDGFYSAEYITATSVSGLIYSNTSAPTANATYTLQVWAKRGPGMSSDVAGKIFLRDLTAGSGSDQSIEFTATDTWQRLSVSITMGATVTSGLRAYLGFDGALASVNDEILYWGAQVIEGTLTVDAPYIRTAGSTASLAVPSYRAAVTSGDLIRAASGEFEIVALAYRAGLAGSNGYLIEAEGSSNDDRRVVIWSGTTGAVKPRFLAYDSSSVLQVDVQTGVVDSDGQESTIVAQWDAAGGIAGGVDGQISHNGGAAVTDAGSFTSADSNTGIQIGNYTSVGSAFAPDSLISRIRIWGGPR